MKKHLSILLLGILSFFVLVFTTCSKEDDPAIRKKSITNHLISEISSDSLQSYVRWMEGMGNRFSLSENHRKVAVRLLNKFKGLGYSNSRLDSFMVNKTYRTINYSQWQYNVIASIEGSLNTDSVCVIGAHYDDHLLAGDPFSIIPGANDNASGVAATFEIARIMKLNRFAPLYTIEFVAFGAEEIGLYGSIRYVTTAWENSRKVKMMLNNDMIAYQPNSEKLYWKVNIIDYDNSHALRREAEELCSQFTALNFINDNTHNKQSDSYPFFVAGFKSLFFASEIIDPNYHTLNDLASNCNFEYCAEVVKLCCALLVYNN
jgi:bacterial leucyl aminopeptidase